MGLLDQAMAGKTADETKPVAGNFTEAELIEIGAFMELGPYGQRSKLVHDCVMDGVSTLLAGFEPRLVEQARKGAKAYMDEKAKEKAAKAAKKK